MSKEDESRRAFLKGAAAGAGVVATAALAPDALAQTRKPDAPAMAHMEPGGAGHGAFFNSEESATIAAFTERLMPGAPGKPGANDAGVLNQPPRSVACARRMRRPGSKATGTTSYRGRISARRYASFWRSCASRC